MQIGIHQIVREGSRETLQELLEAGADVNLADGQGWSPLARAIEQRRPELARLLLANGADVHACDRRGRQPLLWAAQYGPDSLVEELLHRGADATAADKNGKTPLMQAVRHGRTAIVEMLLNRGNWTEWDRRDFWRRCFFAALQDRRFEIVEAFLKAGQNVECTDYYIRPWDYHSVTALMQAVMVGDLRLVDLLLRYGADVGRKSGRHSALTEALTRHGVPSQITQTLLARGVPIGLEEAVVAGDAALVESILVEGADPEMPDDRGETLLLWAARCRRPEMVRLLAKYGANPLAQDQHRGNALMPAAEAGDIVLAEFLIAQGANPNAPTPAWREPPLACAAGAGQLAATRWFLERFGLGPDQGAFALDVATARGHLEVVRLLLDAGVDVDASIAYHHGRRPLMWAALRGNVPITKLLLERGAAADAGPWSAVELAAGAGCTKTVRLLLDRNLPAEQKNGALLVAISTGHDETAEALLQAGADPNVAGYAGRTALIWAARMCRPPLVEALLNRGANVEAADDAGHTALMWAEQAGRAENAALLASRG